MTRYKVQIQCPITIEKQEGRSGPRPIVDYLIRGNVEDRYQSIFKLRQRFGWSGNIQISDYMSNFALYTKGAVCGLIIDQIAFQMHFLLFSDENGKVQPVTLVNPPIEYRSLDRNTYNLKDIPIHNYSTLLFGNGKKCITNRSA